MSKFIVVLSDSTSVDDMLGHQLVRFLQQYAPGEVKITTPIEILKDSPTKADIVFVSLPTSFGPDHAVRIHWKKVVLFDYFDDLLPEWRDSNQEFLSSLTDCYLKTHTKNGINFGFRAGTLPLPLTEALGRRYEKYTARRRWRDLGALVGRKSRPWDVTFVGAVTFLERTTAGEPPQRYHQRVEWIREVDERNDWRFRGGLIEQPYCRFTDLEDEGYPVPERSRLVERLTFRDLFVLMTRTRVSLTPTGHARWTYRHYESVYAGCDVVSTDLSGVRTLIPLPTHCFEIVPDCHPVSPSVEKVLKQWRDRVPLREAALEHFEQYLVNARYDARRPAIFEQFLAQVEED